MNSSNSEVYSLEKQSVFFIDPALKIKKKKDYICPCGRSYGSYPALYSHVKRKHDGKPPGDVIKPKALRRRGRPFKYEPIKLQSQNSHKNASKHLRQYLRNIQKEDSKQFPLKQFAIKNKNKIPFINLANQQQFAKFQHFQLIRQNYHHPIYHQSSQKHRMDFQNGYPFINHTNDEQNITQKMQRSEQQQKKSYDLTQERNLGVLNEKQLNNLFQSERMKNHQDHKEYQKKQSNLQGQMQNPYGRLNNFRAELGEIRESYDAFELMYSKPFELTLKEQMAQKFRPIAQGLTDFLDPILKEIINQEQVLNGQNPVLLEESLKQIQNQAEQIICQENHYSEKKTNRKPYQNSSNQLRQTSNQNKKMESTQDKVKKSQYRIENLLENQHFQNILNWMMSPPEEISGKQNQNYIEFSFRSCLVEFLDFTNNFLETIQYEQILLFVVFFCDHILQVTGSFQLSPEPQIYEMCLYFNSFIHQYLPKLMVHFQMLQSFFIFSEFKKKASELLMWMSSWQSIQQYYHNKYFKELINHQICEQNYKTIMYQKSYQSYIREANKQYPDHRKEPVFQNQFYDFQNQQPQQKQEQNPEILVAGQNDPVTDQQMKNNQHLSQQSQNLNSIHEQDQEIQQVNSTQREGAFFSQEVQFEELQMDKFRVKSGQNIQRQRLSKQLMNDNIIEVEDRLQEDSPQQNN